MKKVQRSIACLLALVLMISMGVTNTYAASDTFITRGQLAALINQTFQIKLDKPKQKFADVPASDPNAKDIAIAVTVGYMKGNVGNKFNPNSKVTGAELAVIACNLLSYKGIQASDSITDVPVWAAPYYAALDDFGLLDDLGLPKGNVTIQQAQSFVTTLSYWVFAAANNNPYGAKQVGLKDDFFLYTNRKYVANPVIHTGYPAAGTFIDVMHKVDDSTVEIMKDLQGKQASAVASSTEWRAAEIYAMYTDTAARDKGIEKLRPYLDELFAVKDVAELNKLAEKYRNQFNLIPFIGAGFDEDTLVNKKKYAAYFMSSGLGLISPNYYSNDQSVAKVQQAYLKMIEQELSYIGSTDHLPERAKAIFELEKQLSTKATPQEKLNDPKVYLTKSTWDEMKKATPNSNLANYIIKAYDVPADMTVYCPELDYIKLADSLISNQNLQAIKDMLALRMLNSYMPAFSEKARHLGDELNKELMGMLPEEPSIEARAASLAQGMEPQAFDKVYVSKYFPESSKKDVQNMVSEIIAKYETRINNLTWMSNETKAKAVEKLKNIKVNIGYPDVWKTVLPYSFTSKDKGGTMFDVLVSQKTAADAAVKENIKKPYSVDVWDYMSAMTVNAFYNPNSNSITFPAGILQAPFYDPKASREQNLGAIGSVIGHEISHAFDNSGAQFDKDGNLANWWTEADLTKFQSLTAKMALELSEIEMMPGSKLNGELTLGETIADLGGLSCVLDIADDNPNADLSQLFEGYAHTWASWYPVELTSLYMQFDAHAPDKVRVNFILQMLDQFYEEYQITEKDAMYLPPEKRIAIW